MSEYIFSGPPIGKVAYLTATLAAVERPLVWPPAAGELYVCVLDIGTVLEKSRVLFSEAGLRQCQDVAAEDPRTFLVVDEAAAYALEPDLQARLAAAS